jgi:hypothetical protein
LQTSSKQPRNSKRKPASLKHQQAQQHADESDAAWEDEDGGTPELGAGEQDAAAYDPALYSLTGRPMPPPAAIDLGNNMQLLYTRRQVVAIVLPPNSAPTPVALVELQEDVICCASSSSSSSSSSGSGVAFTKPSDAGIELVELEDEVHVYERAGGKCRVAGANIRRAVRMAKMHSNDRTAFVLEADEWDTLALQTLCTGGVAGENSRS